VYATSALEVIVLAGLEYGSEQASVAVTAAGVEVQ
jgi:hypothetical protein